MGSDNIFAIMADGSIDVVGQEKLTVCVRYVCSITGKIQERTIGTINLPKTDAATIYEKIKFLLNRLGLNLNQVRGQGYDGAANMCGHLSGVATKVMKDNPLALYVHCCNHRLNLIVQKSVLELRTTNKRLD